MTVAFPVDAMEDVVRWRRVVIHRAFNPRGVEESRMPFPRLDRRGIAARAVATDPEERFRAELLVGFALFELTVTSLVAITELIWGTPAFAQLYGVTILVIILVLWRYIRGGRLDAAA
ncbi:MAG TPA: hypothetical protein VFY65_10515, partial [Longimicrobium sp.]|nr:hypothetical protein [Longimicrobium sp.]